MEPIKNTAPEDDKNVLIDNKSDSENRELNTDIKNYSKLSLLKNNKFILGSAMLVLIILILIFVLTAFRKNTNTGSGQNTMTNNAQQTAESLEILNVNDLGVAKKVLDESLSNQDAEIDKLKKLKSE